MNATYRAHLLVLGFQLAAIVAVYLLVVGRLDEDIEMSGDVQVGVQVAYGVLAALLMTVVGRSSTTVTDEGIVVRRFGPAKHYPWAEITDIRIERIHTWSRIRRFGVRLYDAELRRIVLPHVNDWSLDGAKRARAVTRDLRRRVAEAAGAEWRAREAKVDQLLDKRLGRIGVVGAAMAIAAGAAVLAAIVFEVL